MLGMQLGLGIAGVTRLEHELGLASIHKYIQILLTAKRLYVTPQAVILRKHCKRQGGCQTGRRQAHTFCDLAEGGGSIMKVCRHGVVPGHEGD